MNSRQLILDSERVPDLALDFIENEVGRHDWKNNWPAFKAKHQTPDALKTVIQTWLDYIGEQCDPTLVIVFIDGLCQERAGKWR